jgi:hypothetical protein
VCGTSLQVKELKRGVATAERRAERSEEDLLALRNRLRSGTQSQQQLIEENLTLGSHVRIAMCFLRRSCWKI